MSHVNYENCVEVLRKAGEVTRAGGGIEYDLIGGILSDYAVTGNHGAALQEIEEVRLNYQAGSRL